MKVSTALICLDCDELHTDSVCPKCLSHSSFPLRKWFPPLADFEAIKKEARKHGRYIFSSNNKIQKNAQEIHRDQLVIQSDSYFVNPVTPLNTGLEVYSADKSRLHEDSKIAPFRPEISCGNHYSGEQLETESSIEQRGNRSDASPSHFWKNLCRSIKSRFVRSRKEHSSGVQDIEDVSKTIENAWRSFGKVFGGSC